MTRLYAALAVLCLGFTMIACVPPIDTTVPSGSSVPTDGRTPTTPSGSSGASATSAATTPPAVVTWTRIAPAGLAPVARSGHTWTADPSSASAYLYAGRAAGATLGDLWVYDLAADAWARVLVTGASPPPRSGHAAAWIDDVGLIVIGGRDEDGEPIDDAWRFDPATGAWGRLAASSERPTARSDSCAAVGPDGRVWITHGLAAGGQALDDTWSYGPPDAAWTTEPLAGRAPLARAGHGCWWSDDGRLLLFGGLAGAGPLADLWALANPGASGSSWSTVDPTTAIGARSDAAIVRHDDRIVVYGGLGTDGAAKADLGTFGTAELTIDTVALAGDAPAGRSRATLVDDPAAERMLLFGGVTATGPTDELWQAVLDRR